MSHKENAGGLSVRTYEQGYRDGESSVTADWTAALSECFGCDPDELTIASVVAKIEALQGETS